MMLKAGGELIGAEGAPADWTAYIYAPSGAASKKAPKREKKE